MQTHEEASGKGRPRLPHHGRQSPWHPLLSTHGARPESAAKRGVWRWQRAHMWILTNQNARDTRTTAHGPSQHAQHMHICTRFTALINSRAMEPTQRSCTCPQERRLHTKEMKPFTDKKRGNEGGARPYSILREDREHAVAVDEEQRERSAHRRHVRIKQGTLRADGYRCKGERYRGERGHGKSTAAPRSHRQQPCDRFPVPHGHLIDRTDRQDVLKTWESWDLTWWSLSGDAQLKKRPGHPF